MNHPLNWVLILEYGTTIVNHIKLQTYSLCSASKFVGILYSYISVQLQGRRIL